MNRSVREILQEVGELPCDVRELSLEGDLYRAGLKSLAVVRVMVALEQEYKVEFRSDMLTRDTFSSIRAIGQALQKLGADHNLLRENVT
jgi:acyl carrier protein